MSSPHQEEACSSRRYERYKAVVDRLVERTAFVLADIHQTCYGEQSAFVTRVVNELIESGWLVRKGQRQPPNYRWSQGRGEFDAGQGCATSIRERD